MNTPNISNDDIKASHKAISNIHLSTVKVENPNLSELDREVRELLSNKLRARAFLRRCDYEHVSWLQEMAEEVLDEKQAQYEREQERKKLKEQTRNEVLALIKERGFSLADITGETVAKKSTYIPRKKKLDPNNNVATHRWNIFGKTYYWRGKGRLPATLKCWIAAGNNLRDAYLPEADQFGSEDPFDQSVPKECKKEAEKLKAKYKEMGEQQ